MASTLTQIASVVAGLRIVATAFLVAPGKGLKVLRGGGAAVALGVAAALLIAAIRNFAP